jgi:16S rRNA (cytidine1402-2'-O)-methyltransferase
MPAGRLYVVATPIGNLEDITARALRVLREADLVAAEDTRHTGRLLGHFGITTPLTSYHEHNEQDKAEALVLALEEGHSVALVSDAGTPCISDPGYRVVRAARERGIPVEAVPGPSALTAALSVSGLPTDRFTFHGFFPRKASQAARLLDEARALGGTHVFYEAPGRLTATLRLLADALPDCEAAVARELTKRFEELACGAPSELLAAYAERAVKGECVVLVHTGAGENAGGALTDADLRDLVEERLSGADVSRRDAVKAVAEATGVPRNRVYAAAGKG